uniref:Carbohydrate binding module family 25 domain-containing protein n=1 Tax=Eiseniibacteriota bacterium TaxID=2212470 RepID=A0A832HYW7_UNCEI
MNAHFTRPHLARAARAARALEPLAPPAALLALAALLSFAHAPFATAGPIHTSYLWHMHQPIYWPDLSGWNGKAYEFAHETIQTGHSLNDEFSIFNSDDRVRDYQDYPKLALERVLDLPDAGAQVSFAGALIQNVKSLADAGWNGGRYAPAWYAPYRQAMGWTTSGGRRRLEPVLVAFHHSINPLVDDAVFRRMLQTQKAIHPVAWGAQPVSVGFFPAEMCFSERLIPTLVAEGVQWSIVPDVHIARATENYPYAANQDNCDPPNRADQLNPAQPYFHAQTISRGVTTKIPVPYGFQPRYAQHVDPHTGQVHRLIVVPAANAMGWNEGYAPYGTGEIDAIAARNDPAKPMLILFAHDGDNAWAGGNTYYESNVTDFCHDAAAAGYRPSTIAEYLADYPPDPDDVVKVEDGGWVNADGDFGSPQFINWNWPLVNASGAFDIPGGWAEDERNWAVLTAAVNHVLTAEQMSGQTPDAARIADPTQPGATSLEQAWHFLLAGHESGYMYYGASLDMEIKPTLAANRAVQFAQPLLGGTDLTAPTVWIPQRLPWNPGGKGGGALWGYPGGAGADMTRDFWVWTFVHDVSGVDTVVLRYRLDLDGVNPLASIQNDTYAGGPEVGPWQTLPMTRRAFPAGDVFNLPEIDFTVMPSHIAEQWSAHVTGLDSVLVDYYVEATDVHGNVRRSPIQHVWVGSGGAAPGGPVVTWAPPAPVAGDTVRITYDAGPGTLPDAVAQVRIHVGHSGWTQILNPDPAMTREATTTRWSYTYAIPPAATSVDVAFNDGAGTWDNNGGADWHIPVSGGTPPPHVVDGALDPGLSPVASCGGLDLYAEHDGRWLYLAVPAVGATSGRDHFVFVARDSGALRAAPWAKAGQAATWDLHLGNEDSNNWHGWFDAAGALVTSGLQSAAGAWLEGLVDLEAAFGTAPQRVRVAFGAWSSPDGGALLAQVPCGDADGALEAAEHVVVAASGTVDAPERAAPRGSAPRLSLRSGNPTTGEVRLTLDPAGAGRVRVELSDLAGRRVATLHDGEASGALALRADLRALGGPLPAGVYFLRATTPAGAVARRVVLLP